MTGVYADLERFIATHRPCGDIVGDADEPTPAGYRLWLRCGCGAIFNTWVTPTDAIQDLVNSRLSAGEN